MPARPISPDDIGGIVRVRQRHYLVDEVSRRDAAPSTIARLSCIDPDDLGRPLEVIWEREIDAEVLPTERWGLLGDRGFDPPDRFSAYYHTLRWNRVTASRTDRGPRHATPLPPDCAGIASRRRGRTSCRPRSAPGSASTTTSSNPCGWRWGCRG